MTKYILAGGADRKHSAYMQALRAEIAKTLPGPKRVLSCVFAEPREAWEEKFAARERWFKDGLGEETSVTLAFPDAFKDQVEASDVIYLHGGDDALLAHYLDRISDLSDLWSGKIVIGSSAGADYLSNKYWTCDWRKASRGRGLVNLNVIPHFESEEYGVQDPRGPIDWTAARQDLRATLGPDDQVTPLREGEFVVVET